MQSISEILRCMLLLKFAFIIYPIAIVAIQPDIRADSNRDGVVDVSGTSDLVNKQSWADPQGALFLPNIGDSLSRCQVTDRTGHPLSDRELAACNDAAGDFAHSPQYFAPIRVLPMPAVSDNATAYVAVSPLEHKDRVRLFVRDPEWRYINDQYSFNSSQLRSGIELGLDAREPITDAGLWDGKISVQLFVADGNDTGRDEVAFKVAPVLLHHHLQSVESLVATAATDIDPEQGDFLEELDSIRKEILPQSNLILINGSSRGFWYTDEGSGILEYNDIVAQDFLEPAYSSIPGPDGPISIRIMIRSPQPSRQAGRQIFEALRAKGIGGFQVNGALGFEEINSFGNVETAPPHTAPTGKMYMAGRIVIGMVRGRAPDISRFLQAQEVQEPLFINMDWTLAGHTDEMVSFIPFDNDKGWTIAVPDVDLGIKVLTDTVATGHGSVQAFSKSNISVFFDNQNLTVREAVAQTSFIETQEYAKRHITANLALLQSEMGIPDHEVIRVPSLYFAVEEGLSFYYRPDGLRPRVSPPPPGERHLVAFYPTAVNGVVIGRNFIAPKIWGPVVDGVDLFQQAVVNAYRDSGLTVHFVNTVETIHYQGGEVHCATNTIRDASQIWWKW